MRPTRNSRWSYPVTMCLAPRYSSGPMACPCNPWRNTASFPETPCASSPAEKPRTSMATAMSAMLRPRSPIPDPRSLLLSLIFGMTGITRLVDRGTGIQDSFLVVRFGGLDRQLALLDHGARDRDPITVVDDAVAHQQQIPRLDERRGLTRQRGPFLVVLRRCLLDAI